MLQECRVFHDSNIVTSNPRLCCQLITKLLHIITQVRARASWAVAGSHMQPCRRFSVSELVVFLSMPHNLAGRPADEQGDDGRVLRRDEAVPVEQLEPASDDVPLHQGGGRDVQPRRRHHRHLQSHQGKPAACSDLTCREAFCASRTRADSSCLSLWVCFLCLCVSACRCSVAGHELEGGPVPRQRHPCAVEDHRLDHAGGHRKVRRRERWGCAWTEPRLRVVRSGMGKRKRIFVDGGETSLLLLLLLLLLPLCRACDADT